MREEWRLLAQALAADGMCQYAVMAARGKGLHHFIYAVSLQPNGLWHWHGLVVCAWFNPSLLERERVEASLARGALVPFAL